MEKEIGPIWPTLNLHGRLGLIFWSWLWAIHLMIYNTPPLDAITIWVCNMLNVASLKLLQENQKPNEEKMETVVKEKEYNT